MDQNPFQPGFGKQPPLLVGRRGLADRFWAAINTGPQSDDYAMVLTGIRGSGKTAFMGAVRDAAQRRGWGVIKATAVGNDRLEASIAERALLPEALPHRFNRVMRRRDGATRAPMLRRGRRRLRGLQVAGFGAEWESVSQVALSETLRQLGFRAARKGRGLLLTVDEMHQGTEMELKNLSVCLQELAEESLPVAFLGAGLPELTPMIDDQDGLTFFQRCGRASVGLLSDEDARRALAEPIRHAGREIDEDALDEAVSAAIGYPYKLQLIGSNAWSSAGAGTRITRGIARGAIHEANHTMVTKIVVPIWTHLTADQQDILTAMSEDDTLSHVDDMVQRTGMSKDVARDHLMRLEIVGAVQRLSPDEAQFIHPLMRGWIRVGGLISPDTTLGVPHHFVSDRVAGGNSDDPANLVKTVETAKQRILAAHASHPGASNAQLAKLTGTSRSYVGKVLRKAKLR